MTVSRDFLDAGIRAEVAVDSNADVVFACDNPIGAAGTAVLVAVVTVVLPDDIGVAAVTTVQPIVVRAAIDDVIAVGTGDPVVPPPTFDRLDSIELNVRKVHLVVGIGADNADAVVTVSRDFLDAGICAEVTVDTDVDVVLGRDNPIGAAGAGVLVGVITVVLSDDIGIAAFAAVHPVVVSASDNHVVAIAG